MLVDSQILKDTWRQNERDHPMKANDVTEHVSLIRLSLIYELPDLDAQDWLDEIETKISWGDYGFEVSPMEATIIRVGIDLC